MRRSLKCSNFKCHGHSKSWIQCRLIRWIGQKSLWEFYFRKLIFPENWYRLYRRVWGHAAIAAPPTAAAQTKECVQRGQLSGHWFNHRHTTVSCNEIWVCNRVYNQELVFSYISCLFNFVFDLFIHVFSSRNAVFSDGKPCGSYRNRRFGGTYSLHHQGAKRWARNNVGSN
jgi:hypothetical protein